MGSLHRMCLRTLMSREMQRELAQANLEQMLRYDAPTPETQRLKDEAIAGVVGWIDRTRP